MFLWANVLWYIERRRQPERINGYVNSSQTVQRLRSSIAGPRDPRGKCIETQPGTVTADYLTRRRILFVEVNDGAGGGDLLIRGKVQAIVYDAPTPQYCLARSNRSDPRIVGPHFMPEMYGVAVAVGSRLRKRINEALLEVYQDGTYELIYEK